MNNEQQPNTSATGEYNEYETFAFHPYNVLLILVLFGIAALFLAFSASFIYSRIQNGLPPIKLPLLFFINTVILLGTSATMVWAKKSYKADDTKAYQNALKATIALSIIFMIAQFFAWKQLIDQEIYINSDNSAGYLYLISGMQFLHVIAGLPFLGAFLWVGVQQVIKAFKLSKRSSYQSVQ